MATSRTGTAQWKKVRAQAIYRAKRAGQVYCPECGCILDYTRGMTPTSAEVDHILPHSQGGQDVLSNTRVICRFDNQSLGGKAGNPKKPSQPIKTSREW